MIFQDFPGPGIFKKKIQDFPGGVGTLNVRRTNPREEGLWESKMDWLLKTEEATVGYEDLKMLAQDRTSWSQ